jgi:NFU1 iron-sulfur cluster scaffold homolog, mitochondrial
MEPMSIKIKPENSSKCRFTVEQELSNGELRFDRSQCPHGNEMADAILGLPGIDEIVVSGATVTVIKSDARDWRELEEPIAYALQLGIPRAATEPTESSGVVDEDELFDEIEGFFESEINPSVASHGGKVELIDIQDNTLIVRMMGGCQGCGMANVTLKQGIEGSVKQHWPVIEGIRDITDHESGTNPYFQAEKK